MNKRVTNGCVQILEYYLGQHLQLGLGARRRGHGQDGQRGRRGLVALRQGRRVPRDPERQLPRRARRARGAVRVLRQERQHGDGRELELRLETVLDPSSIKDKPVE